MKIMKSIVPALGIVLAMNAAAVMPPKPGAKLTPAQLAEIKKKCEGDAHKLFGKDIEKFKTQKVAAEKEAMTSKDPKKKMEAQAKVKTSEAEIKKLEIKEDEAIGKCLKHYKI